MIETLIDLPDKYVEIILTGDIKKEIKKIEKERKVESGEISYVILLKILRNKVRTNINDIDFRDLLFDSVYWASKIETKRKIRPKNYKELPREKPDNYFTNLQKHYVLYSQKKYKEKELLLKIELESFFRLCFELTCIKRDRT